MEIYYTEGFTKMMALRQGLHRNEVAAHEMPARRTMIDYTDDFRWKLSDRVVEWAATNCVGEITLRYDSQNHALIVGAKDPTDLTLLATAF